MINDYTLLPLRCVVHLFLTDETRGCKIDLPLMLLSHASRLGLKIVSVADILSLVTFREPQQHVGPWNQNQPARAAECSPYDEWRPVSDRADVVGKEKSRLIRLLGAQTEVLRSTNKIVVEHIEEQSPLLTLSNTLRQSSPALDAIMDLIEHVDNDYFSFHPLQAQLNSALWCAYDASASRISQRSEWLSNFLRTRSDTVNDGGSASSTSSKRII